MKKSRLLGAVCACVIFATLTLSSFAYAAPVYFYDRASFDAATGGGLDFESFEADFSVAPIIIFSGFTVGESNGDNGLGQLRNFPGIVDGAITDGTGALGFTDNGDSIGTFFSFNRQVTAFGLDITTNPGSAMTIGGSVTDSIILGNDTASFWGVIDMDGIASITFSASGSPNVGFDAVSYSAVPVPAAVWLFGSGLLGLVGMARRKKAA